MTILLSNIDLVPPFHIAASSLRDLVQVLPERILADVALSAYTFAKREAREILALASLFKKKIVVSTGILPRN
jgi:hypothetical protein